MVVSGQWNHIRTVRLGNYIYIEFISIYNYVEKWAIGSAKFYCINLCLITLVSKSD